MDGAPSMALDDIVRGIEIVLDGRRGAARGHRRRGGRDRLMQRQRRACYHLSRRSTRLQ